MEYRADGEFGIVKWNWDALKHVAAAEAVVGAPATRADTVWSRRPGAAWAATRKPRSHRTRKPRCAAAGSQAADVGRRRRAGCQPRERRRRAALCVFATCTAAGLGALSRAFPTFPTYGRRWRAADAAECDEECKQRIAERRQLFEQSRTTNDRQKILDLSRQRAAMYNTTFNGASCIPGLPCW